jgi:hypothetical protein
VEALMFVVADEAIAPPTPAYQHSFLLLGLPMFGLPLRTIPPAQRPAKGSQKTTCNSCGVTGGNTYQMVW